MRTALNLAAICALAALASCSFQRIDGAIEIDVTGMPSDSVRAELVLIDSTGRTYKREPHFGAGVYTGETLVLTLPAMAEGAFTVQVSAYDDNNYDADSTDTSTPVAVGNGAATYTAPSDPDAPLLVVPIALVSNGALGAYGTPCIPTGTGTNLCASGLICEQYSSTDVGVCTSACNGTSNCTASPSGATCEAFLGDASTTYCQWECSADGGACPTGLTCGLGITASGGKHFCQGTAP